MTRPDTNKRFSQSIRPELETNGLRVKKVDNLHLIDKHQGMLPVTMTVCPLYSPGKLSESQLIEPPFQIADSRVHLKWATAQNAAEVIQRMGHRYGFTPRFEVSFADRGVIMADSQQPVEALLDYHYSLYQDVLRRTLGEEAFNLHRYSQFGIPFSQTIEANASEDQVMAANFTEPLKERGIEFRPDMIHQGQLHHRGEKLIRKLITQIGSAQLALELMTQYGLYDGQTADPYGLNLYIERESAGLLLQITDLFAHSRYPRIDLIT